MSSHDPQDSSTIAAMGRDSEMLAATGNFLTNANKFRYSYNFKWLGRPIIQFPQDIMAVQELIWSVKPDLIIETGVAHGGSLILSASILQLIGGSGRVLGVDIDIRAHNRVEIENHPLSNRITLLQGSSIDPEIVQKVRDFAKGCSKVMVFLDSNHTHDHVAKELEAYSPLVNKGSYLVVFDTLIENFPPNSFPDRPWDVGNNPMTAVHSFLKTNDRFQIDREIQDKLQITVAPDGYLVCTKDLQ
jgi:cephalosporin hydroxylase